MTPNRRREHGSIMAFMRGNRVYASFVALGFLAACRMPTGSHSKLHDADSDTPQFVELSISDQKLDLSVTVVAKVPAKSNAGYNFPYYLFVPKDVDRGNATYIYVEPNNTGAASDNFAVHDQAARGLASSEYPTQIARQLKAPLLVPVFPRPSTDESIYTQYLDRETLLIKEGPLKRIDLQLAAMIQDAQKLLRNSGISVQPKVFMHGFSASSGFTLRFTVLHPELVRAVAAGGVNALPIFPVTQWQGSPLRYALGISDLQQVSGAPFNRSEYLKVAQYIYMGYFDHNDTMPYRDAWDEDDATLIKKVFETKMMPNRWALAQKVFQSVQAPAQFVTYNGTSHEIRSEMIADLAKFFAANRGGAIAKIQPHSYPFAEWRALPTAHVKSALWRGDQALPGCFKDFNDGHFAILINDWIAGQDYYQLSEFTSNAGFRFFLRATAHADIAITEENLGESISDSSGSCQGFVVVLSDEQLAAMATDVEYTLVPVNSSKQFVWSVPPAVKIKKGALPSNPGNGTKFDKTATVISANVADLGPSGCKPNALCIVLGLTETIEAGDFGPLSTMYVNAPTDFSLTADGRPELAAQLFGITLTPDGRPAFTISLDSPVAALMASGVAYRVTPKVPSQKGYNWVIASSVSVIRP